MEIWIAKAECGRDKKGEYAEWSTIIWKQMLWSLGTGFGLLIKMAENVLTVSEAMPRAPALHCSNFSLLVMQWYIYAETCGEYLPLTITLSFPRAAFLSMRGYEEQSSGNSEPSNWAVFTGPPAPHAHTYTYALIIKCCYWNFSLTEIRLVLQLNQFN